jgi:acyl-CoA reductase-like NAD-dependent aldehyde dehydrogenase
VALILSLPLSLIAQQSSESMFPQVNPRAVQAPGTRPGQRIRQVPCWQEAGVTKAAMEQRRTIEENVKSQVASVCANSSLTPQQRQQQIRQIHEQARQQLEALISPQQQEAIKSCQASRGHGGGGVHVGGGGRGTGLCGEMPSAKSGRPQPPAPSTSSQP